MSIECKVREAAGYGMEELNGHCNTPEAHKQAREGRNLRNEVRVEDGKAPRTTPVGSGSE